MPVNILIKSYGYSMNEPSGEENAAFSLKRQFEEELKQYPQASGEILIINNVTLFGQEIKDIDLIVLANLSNFKIELTSRAINHKNELLEERKREIFVNTFCYVIELKDHPVSGVRRDGLHLYVKYNNYWSDATSQSEKQKYSLKNFLLNNLGFSPYICNFIWLHNLSTNEVVSLFGIVENNILPSEFSLKELLIKSTLLQNVYIPQNKEYGIINSINHELSGLFNPNEIIKAFNLFLEVKKSCGNITRKKIEQITQKILEQQNYANNIGDRLTILSGRAGTGKTIKLLRIACDLAQNRGLRCIVLTYNHALVSDIRRVLALTGIPDGIDNYTVQISTLHSFFYKLLYAFGFYKEEPCDNNSFDKNYTLRMEELFGYLKENIIDKNDIADFIKCNSETFSWDYILIDEAQDWRDIEKTILFAIFGKKRIIIADGIDQFVRSNDRQNWTRGLKESVDFQKKMERKGLRQKRNLVTFVNAFADKCYLNWKVEPNNNFIGGRVIITTKPYSVELHEELFQECISTGNTAYDILFLVPPQKVSCSTAGNQSFINIDIYKEHGIHLFDGTNGHNRNAYPVNLNESRLFQYDSCRGLEGWITICLDFDDLIKYKKETYTDIESCQLELNSFEERRDNFINLWSLMPFTRPIDTLVITLKNKNSHIAKVLEEISIQYSDFIEWR